MKGQELCRKCSRDDGEFVSIMFLWDVMRCNLVYTFPVIRNKYFASVFKVKVFYPEDLGGWFFRNVIIYPVYYMASHPGTP
jgi:hypothetical protein